MKKKEERKLTFAGAARIYFANAKPFIPAPLFPSPPLDNENAPPPGLAQTLLRDIELSTGNPQKGTISHFSYNGEDRKYACLSSAHDPKTGTYVSAFKEIDPESGSTDHSPLLLYCCGTHFNTLKIKDVQRATSMIVAGKRSPRISFVANWFNEEIKPLMDHGENTDVHIYGYSAGVPNALHLKHLLDAHANVDMISFEPFGDVPEARFIASDAAKDNPSGPIAYAALKQLLKNVTTIQADPPTWIRRVPIGHSDVNNRPCGDSAYILKTPRNCWLNNQYHGCAAVAKLIRKDGEGVLSRCKDSVLLCEDEILHPEKHPHSFKWNRY